jgi:hypothetical protein
MSLSGLRHDDYTRRLGFVRRCDAPSAAFGACLQNPSWSITKATVEEPGTHATEVHL